MKVISFDVGIKNMAYCLFDISGDHVSIADWKVLSLIEEDAPVAHCNCPARAASKTKTKPLSNFFMTETAPLCGRIAKFKKGEQYFCDKHSKSQTAYRLPDKTCAKKMSLEELVTYATSLGLLSLPKKKADVLTLVENYLREHSLEPVISKKGTQAGGLSLVVLGQNMKRIFNEVFKDVVIDYVLIENQISPLANRMKTIQGMLAQTFIMMYDKLDVEFISSANKLKMFSKENTKAAVKEDKTESQIYKAHKKDGVFYCEQVLEKGEWDKTLWTNCEKKKKDDLADCFLQGIWWLIREGKPILV